MIIETVTVTTSVTFTVVEKARISGCIRANIPYAKVVFAWSPRVACSIEGDRPDLDYDLEAHARIFDFTQALMLAS